jgi:hypothetical protein
MFNKRAFMKTKWKITGLGGWLPRSPKSPPTSCLPSQMHCSSGVRYAGTLPNTCSASQTASFQSPYNPWAFVKTAPCVLSGQVTWSPLFTGKDEQPLPHSMHLRYVRRSTTCCHWGLNVTTHLHQVLKLMAQPVYWPVYELDDQGIVFDARKGQSIFLFSTWFTPTRVPHILLFSGYWPLPSSAEVKNTWSYTSSTPYVFRIKG